MTAQAFYGSFPHDARQVSFNSWSREYVDGQTGYHKLERVTAEIKYRIIRSTVSLIQLHLAEVLAAYSFEGQSFLFVDANGNPTNWSLDSGSAVGGVRVLKRPSHGAIQGADGVTFLDCVITLQADYLIQTPQNAYLTFSESLTFTGRGQGMYVERTPATGLPFKQKVSERSFYYCTQSGSATSTDQSIQPMQPMFPDAFVGNPNDSQITPFSPLTTRGQPTEYGKSWTYQFSSPTPLVGNVNVR